MRVSYSIVFVSDMNRAVSFYRDVMGLPLKFESPEWTEFKNRWCNPGAPRNRRRQFSPRRSAQGPGRTLPSWSVDPQP